MTTFPLYHQHHHTTTTTTTTCTSQKRTIQERGHRVAQDGKKRRKHHNTYSLVTVLWRAKTEGERESIEKKERERKRNRCLVPWSHFSSGAASPRGPGGPQPPHIRTGPFKYTSRARSGPAPSAPDHSQSHLWPLTNRSPYHHHMHYRKHNKYYKNEGTESCRAGKKDAYDTTHII